jgi:DNA-binding NarL/FixJ family response regulator
MAKSGESRGPVLVADADPASADACCALLSRAGYQALPAARGGEALRIARDELPVVALIEIELPELNGYQVCRSLREELGQGIGIVLLSATRTTAIDVSSGLLIGADDYVAKPFDPGELLARVVALTRRVATNGAAGHGPGLTGRELEVLRLLADGRGQREIAGALSISPRTVGGHIEHILAKLGVHSRAQAVAAAYRQQLFD